MKKNIKSENFVKNYAIFKEIFDEYVEQNLIMRLNVIEIFYDLKESHYVIFEGGYNSTYSDSPPHYLKFPDISLFQDFELLKGFANAHSDEFDFTVPALFTETPDPISNVYRHLYSSHLFDDYKQHRKGFYEHLFDDWANSHVQEISALHLV